ncbi:YihY/virulence factor BrkB family protein [Xanthomonas massiliensis]|jgi:membrane protein|uniref:YihY/virulence factor BrkB family protein n=1 Tax=Xanthomonas massiliensis TaxID=1720302 RepID=UPI0008242105|nr:YihY/virulence factor BrkB family protein [Xanthomonas massiliensis]
MTLSLSPRVQSLFERLQRSLPFAVGERFVEADVLTQAASLSFYALLSMAPLLVLILWLTASLYPEAQLALQGQVREMAGPEAAAVVHTVLDNARQQPSVGSLAGLWSTLLLFVGATAVFARLQGALNLIFRNPRHDGGGVLAWLRKRVFSFGVVFALGFLLIVSMVLTTALRVAFDTIPSVLPLLGYLVTLLLYMTGFAFLYHFLPDRPVRWREALLGGAITACLFAAGRYGIDLYLARAAPGSAYGSMGTLVIALVWVYYASVVFFAGALITAVLDERLNGPAHAAPAPPPDPPAG